MLGSGRIGVVSVWSPFGQRCVRMHLRPNRDGLLTIGAQGRPKLMQVLSPAGPQWPLILNPSIPIAARMW